MKTPIFKKFKNFISRFSILLAVVFTIAFIFSGHQAVKYTSTNEYCKSCHVHPDAEASWQQSTHYNNNSGVQVNCVECHLPPEGFPYLKEKAKTGLHDLWAYWTKDTSEFDWESKKTLEHGKTIVYNESCVRCHQNLITRNLNEKGIKAHLYYKEHSEELNCINCHLAVGHYNPNYKHEQDKAFAALDSTIQKYTEATKIEKFESFIEKIPGTIVSFDMKAIPGGTFKMGSPDDESFHKTEEGPVRTVTLSPFFMAEKEISWEEYLAFYAETMTTEKVTSYQKQRESFNVDAISGPTPPYGNPDQGWGKGKKPAITMSWHGADVYCRWLSKKTGKKYRLPTEAEWEYACRGGKETPYFFEGDPKSFSEIGFWRKFSSADTSKINSYIVYKLNSKGNPKTFNISPNPYGLINMAGNVAEFCSDWYDPQAYSKTGLNVTNPKGPESGEEHVIRGGYFKSDASDLRSAARDYTQNKDWLKTDPQIPKSVWWYSDCNHVSFRVVCEPDSLLIHQ